MPKYIEPQAFREQNFITEADGDILHRKARSLATRGIRETALKKIRKLYGSVLADRKENNLSMTLDEKFFLKNAVRKKGM